MYYCGNCGAPLSAAASAEGQCQRCGAAITPTGDVIAPGQGGRGTGARWDDASAFPADDPFLDTAPTRGVTFPGGTQPVHSTGRMRAIPASTTRPNGSIALVLVGAVGLLGLVAILFYSIMGGFLNRSDSGNHTSLSTGSTSGSTGTQPTMGATMPPTHATATSAATPGNGATATAMATAMPTATISPTATLMPTNTPQPTATPTPLPATIAISPKSVFRPTCNNLSTTFTISNTGGGTLQWAATSTNSHYIVAPTSGAQPNGAAAATVRVSNINGPGKVIISAAYTTNSPQTFTITCF